MHEHAAHMLMHTASYGHGLYQKFCLDLLRLHCQTHCQMRMHCQQFYGQCGQLIQILVANPAVISQFVGMWG